MHSSTTALSSLSNLTPLLSYSHRAVNRPIPISIITCRATKSSSSSTKADPPGVASAIQRAMEKEEEYIKARADVERKGLDLEGYAIEGVSIGGHKTCVIVPSLNAAFDIGRCMSWVVNQDNLFITDAHLDHIGGLPLYVATRALYSLKPSTIFVPPCIKEDVEKLFEVHRSMCRDELKLDLVALDVGETYEIRNDLVVRSFRTHHVIPSEGYVIYSVRKKLKMQYAHLKGPQIKKIKASGVEIMEHAQWFRNKTILLTHFSSRYKTEDIRQAVLKLQKKVSAKVVALTEGFRSTYS